MAYASQAVYGDDIQDPQEQLVSHQNGTEKISEYQSAEVILAIGKATKGRQDDEGQVENRDDGEELPVRVEPEFEKDPPVGLLLGLGWLLGCVGVGQLGGLASGPRQREDRVAPEGREAFMDGRDGRQDLFDLQLERRLVLVQIRRLDVKRRRLLV